MTSNVSKCDWPGLVIIYAFGHVELLLFVYRKKISKTWTDGRTDRQWYDNSCNFSSTRVHFEQLVCIIWLTGDVNLGRKVDMSKFPSLYIKTIIVTFCWVTFHFKEFVTFCVTCHNWPLFAHTNLLFSLDHHREENIVLAHFVNFLCIFKVCKF